jgi:putative transposase
MQEVARYSYRLRPGAQAERALLDEWYRCRFLWNEAVHQQRTGRRPDRAGLGKLLPEAEGGIGIDWARGWPARPRTPRWARPNGH